MKKSLFSFRVRAQLVWCVAGIVMAYSITACSLLPQKPTEALQIPSSEPTPTAAEMPAAGNIRSFLPFIVIPSSIDLTIGDLEITQAIQTPSNNVPLVANRQAVVRVYAQANLESPVGPVYVHLSAFRDGVQLLGSPVALGPGMVNKSWSRADLSTSFNGTLPQDWLSGEVILVATVDATSQIAEQNELNNSYSIKTIFHNVPALNVTVVPIEYSHLGTRLFPPPSTGFLESALWTIYPVSAIQVTEHAKYRFVGNLGDPRDWEKLLNQITLMKDSENAPGSTVYYGLIPVEDAAGLSWFTGGVAGLGWVGYRASIGLTLSSRFGIDGGNIAAHEIGHNLGRLHSPCGGASGTDPRYPYPGGAIGQYGFNLTAFKVVPNSYKDVMSYCTPVWVSDHTYKGLFSDQLAALETEADKVTDGLLVRANFSLGGFPILQPIYTISGIPSDLVESSEYSLQLVNDAGQVVKNFPVRVMVAEENGISVRAIHAFIPRPKQAFSRLRLALRGQPIMVRGLFHLAATAATLTDLTTPPTIRQTANELIVQWGNPMTPALVRYTPDDGQTWNTVGIDLLGGEVRLDLQSLPANQLRFEIILADVGGEPIVLSWQKSP